MAQKTMTIDEARLGVQRSIDTLAQTRPEAANFTPDDFAAKMEDQGFGTPESDRLVNRGALSKFAEGVDNLLLKNTRREVADFVGGDIDPTTGKRSGGKIRRGAAGFLESAMQPETLGIAVSAGLPGIALKTLGILGTAGFAGQRSFDQSGDKLSATVDAGSTIASLLGAKGLGQLVRSKVGRTGASAVGVAVAEALGGAVGGLPGDVAEVAFAPTDASDGGTVGQRLAELPERLDDAGTIGSLLGGGVVDATVPVLFRKSIERDANIRKKQDAALQLKDLQAVNSKNLYEVLGLGIPQSRNTALENNIAVDLQNGVIDSSQAQLKLLQTVPQELLSEEQTNLIHQIKSRHTKSFISQLADKSNLDNRLFNVEGIDVEFQEQLKGEQPSEAMDLLDLVADLDGVGVTTEVNKSGKLVGFFDRANGSIIKSGTEMGGIDNLIEGAKMNNQPELVQRFGMMKEFDNQLTSARVTLQSADLRQPVSQLNLNPGSKTGTTVDIKSMDDLAVDSPVEVSVNKGKTVNILRGHMLDPDNFLVSEIEGTDFTEGIQATIKHAMENGASSVTIPDSIANNSDIGKMMADLTGSEGTMKPLGQLNADPLLSPSNNDQAPAQGRTYQLDTLKPEWNRALSLHENALKEDFSQKIRSVVAAQNEAVAGGITLNPKQLISKLLEGSDKQFTIENSEIAQRILSTIRNVDSSKIRTFKGDPLKTGLGFFDMSTGDVGINFQQGDLQKVMQVASEELSHKALFQTKQENPAAYKQTVEWANSMDISQRRLMLQELSEAYGIDIDLDYHSGVDFSTDQDRIAYEFTGGIAQVMMGNAWKKGLKSTFLGELKMLPSNTMAWLKRFIKNIRTVLGNGFDGGINNELTPDVQAKLDEALSVMSNSILQADSAHRKSWESLKRMDEYTPSSLAGDSTGRSISDHIPLPDEFVQEFGGEAGRMMNLVNGKDFGDPTENRYERWFMSNLFRAQLHPWTRPLFNELRRYRSKVKAQQMSLLEIIGQDKTGSRTGEESLETYKDMMDSLRKSPAKLTRISRVIDEHQQRREEGTRLLTPEEMKKKGLSDDEVNFVEQLSEFAKQVAIADLNNMTQRDTNLLAAQIYTKGKNNMTPENAAELAGQFSTMGNELGAVQVELQTAQRNKEGLEKSGKLEDPATLGKVNQELEGLRQRKLMLEQNVTAGLEQVLNPILGLEPGNKFVSVIARTLTIQGVARVQHGLITNSEGYAPKTRLKRYVVKVYHKGSNKPDFVKDFNKKSDAERYAADQEGIGKNVRRLDKQQLKDVWNLHTPGAVIDVKARAQAQFTEVIDGLQREALVNDPELIKVLENIKNMYDPLADDVSDVIAVKGDVFKQQRKNVGGFTKEDYIPNLMEYMSMKVAGGQKGVIKARAELELLRPEYDSRLDLKNRTRRDLGYFLEAGQNEANVVRKFVFQYYLGASIKHVLQNSTQNFLNGTPELVRQGLSARGAYLTQAKTSKRLSQFSYTGTTGDKMTDAVLLKAKEDGFIDANTLEFFVPDSLGESPAKSWAGQWMQGKSRGLVEPLNRLAGRSSEALNSFLMSTASFGELVNRRFSLISGVEAAKRLGITEPNKVYEFATNFSDNVNFVGDKSNRPGFQVEAKGWTHSLVQMATSLQSFTINHFSQVYSFMKEGAITGSLDPRTGKRRLDARQLSNPGTKAAIMSGMHMFLIAGAMGIPFAGTLDDWLEALTGWDLSQLLRKKVIDLSTTWFDVEEETGGLIADVIESGLPAAMGIDASGSLGLGQPIQSDPQASTAENVGGIVGGAPLGVASNLGFGAAEILKDPMNWANWQKGLRKAAPANVKHLIRVGDAMFNNRAYDSNNQPIGSPLSDKGSMAVAMGFTPKETSNARNAKLSMQRQEARHSQVKTDFANSIANSIVSGDGEKARLEYEKLLGDERFELIDRGSFISSVTKRIQDLKQDFTDSASLTSQPIHDSVSEAFPSVEFRPRPRVGSSLLNVQVAQLLGERSEVLRKAKSMQSGLQKNLTIDTLVQRGVPPALARLLLSKSKKDQATLLKLLQKGQSN